MHEERTEALRNEVASLFQEGKMDEVVSKILAAGTFVDDDYDLQTYLGAAYSRVGRGEEAVAAFQAALRLRPNVAQAFYNLGAQLVAVGRVDEGRPLVEQTVQEDPHHAAAIALLDQIGRTVDKAPPPAAEWEKRDPTQLKAHDSQSDYLPNQPQSTTPQRQTDYLPNQQQPTRTPPPTRGPMRPIGDPMTDDLTTKSKAGAVIGVVVVLLLVAGAVLGYFWWQKQNSPETAVRILFDAANDRKREVVSDRLLVQMPAELAGLAATQGMDDSKLKDQILDQMLKQPIDRDYEIVSSKVSGESATVTVKQNLPQPGGKKTKRSVDYAMVKRDGKWKLDLFETIKGNPALAAGAVGR